VVNAGSGALDFTVSPVSGPAAAAFSLSMQSGSVTPGSPATITVSAAPGDFAPGTYSARIPISSGSTGQQASLPVSVTIAPRAQRMQLSQRGLLFTAVKSGGVTPPQTVAVLNSGDGKFSWNARSVALRNGAGWVKLSPATGASDATSSSGVTVGVDPSGLDPGQYYAIVRISSDAANSPQDIQVVLNLLAADNNPGAVVGPSGLVFAAGRMRAAIFITRWKRTRRIWVECWL
jgi:uncharacterized membrane protein